MKPGDEQHIAILLELRDRMFREKLHQPKDWEIFVEKHFPWLKGKLL